MRRAKLIVPFLVAIFIMPLLAQGTVSASPSVSSTSDEWRTIRTDVITVRFPSGGRKPAFLWWYNKEPENVYVVKFDGLTEYFTFNSTYYTRRFDASDMTFKKLFEEEIELDDRKDRFFQLDQGVQLHKLKEKLEELIEVVKNIANAWGHPHYLPFSESRWTLQNMGNITANDGKNIGFTFTFNLTKVSNPSFKFAENKVAIRVRFYYTSVNEKVDGLYTYTVGANEMKMDLIVRDWRWNLNLVQPLLSRLRNYGINVPQTKTGLALGIQLASVNRTNLAEVEDDETEDFGNAGRMLVEDRAVSLLKGRFDYDETPLVVTKSLKDYYKLKFASDDKTLAGFFKFVASATVKNSSGSFQVPVKAAYSARGAVLSLFISYPYFNGILVHDPSIGVETPETTKPSTTTPSYQVTVGGSEAALVSAQLIAPQILSGRLVILLVVVATAIAVAMVLARSRGRTVILRSI